MNRSFRLQRLSGVDGLTKSRFCVQYAALRGVLLCATSGQRWTRNETDEHSGRKQQSESPHVMASSWLLMITIAATFGLS
jgi:hypothetical protein